MSLESRIDVLIIGAGPAGIMCANALAMAGVAVRIIDKRLTKDVAGQADGLASRTMEVLQSYGLGERLLREANRLNLYTIWNPNQDGIIECTGRMPIVSDPTALYPFITALQQVTIEAIFLDFLKDHGVEVERPKQPSSLDISDDIDELSNPLSYPVKVSVERLDAIDDDNKTEIIHAKYVIGADGAHSWVRKTLGIRMEGQQTDHVWGVIDLLTETNFPDIRNSTSVNSANGNCLLIPREGEKNRMYIQLSDGDPTSPLSGKFDKSNVNPEMLVSVARKILHPYTLSDPKHVDWWSIYTIGQRIASSYSAKDRVFIVGDACHTHSPRGGQGMNAGINDVHNLSWKLAQVLKGRSRPLLLKTYEDERRKFAEDLVNLDKEFAVLGSMKPKTAENEAGVPSEQFLRAARKRQGFFSGLGIHYSPSTIVDLKHQKCAGNLIVGQRMISHIFVRAADLRPIELHHLLPADVRFKVLFFVGSLTSTRIAELDSFAEELRKPSSFLQNYSIDGEVSSVFDIVTIIATKKHDMNYLLVPAFFRPHWTKVLLDDTDLRNMQGGHGYEKFGIDAGQITVVVVRPDGYVGIIAPSTAVGDLEEYFGSFMVPRGDDGLGSSQCS